MLIGILLSFIMMFSMTATKTYQNKNFQIKNILTLSMTITVSVLLFFQYFIDYETLSIIKEKFIFFKDPLFYLSLFLNFLAQYLVRKSEKNNEKNLIIGQFANFILIALVPLISYFVMMIFSFENTIEVQYSSFNEILLFSFILFVLSILFFIDKIKKKIVIRLDIVILSIIIAAFNFVFINKLMQMYDTEAVYFCSMVFNSFFWIGMLIKQKEYSRVEKRHYPMFVVFGLVYILYSYINIILVNYLPSEHIAIFRTLSAVLSASLFDSIRIKKLSLSKKDISILILLFSTLFMFGF